MIHKLLNQATASLSLTLLSLLAAPVCYAESNPPRPNIIFLLADDLGSKDLGCYDGPVKTPTLDALAASGAKFEQFYAGCPVCSPSRATVLTGRNHIRTGVYSWIYEEGKKANAHKNHKMHLLKREVTIAEILKDNGYATAHIGKWHLGLPSEKLPKPSPSDHGFDYWFGTNNNAIPTHHNPRNFVRNGKALGIIKGYSCQIVVDEALQWLSKREDKKQPFFLNIWFHEPHAPLAAPDKLIQPYSDPKSPVKKGKTKHKKAAIYSGTIDNTDHAIAKLLKGLKQYSLPENTLIIYSSDHGSYLKGRNGSLRGYKGQVWEGGIRIPGIFHWPDHIPAQVIEETPGGLVDLLPTLCDLLDIELPKVDLDGTSLAPLLTQESNEIKRPKPFYWFMHKARPIVAIRADHWSLVADPDYKLSTDNLFRESWIPLIKSGSYKNYRLYDLKNDPSQTTDVADKNPKVLERLKKQLIELNSSIMADGPDWHLEASKINK